MTNSATPAPTRPSMPLGSFIARKRRFAQFVASQNIRVRYDSTVTTAMFNTMDGELIMPILDIGEDAHDGFLLHEVAHAIFTPQGTAWKDAALAIVDGDMKRIRQGAHFLNAVEDVRIERLMKRKFNGAAQYFYHLYKWCAANDFFSLDKLLSEGKTLADLLLIDRINVHYKCGHFMRVPFTASEMPFVRRAAEVETWEEAVALAKAIYDRHKEQSEEEKDEQKENDESGKGEKQPQPKGDDQTESNEADDASGDDGEVDGYDDAEGDADAEDGTDAKGESEDDGKGKPQDGDKIEADAEQGESEAQPTEGNDAEPSDQDDPITQKAFDEALAKVCGRKGRNLYYCTIPEPTDAFVIKMQTVIDQLRTFGSTPLRNTVTKFACTVADVARSTYTEWLNANRPSVTMLGTEFDIRKAADDFRRTTVSDTGILDMSRLHSHRTEDDIFLRNEMVRDGQNHGMVILLDMSASMSNDGNFYESVSQALMLAHFCRRINKPFRLYGFTSRECSTPTFATGNFGGERLKDRVVTLLQDGMSAKDFAEVSGLLLVGAYLTEYTVRQTIRSAEQQNGGVNLVPAKMMLPAFLLLADTPLNTALLGMLKVCEEFKRTRNLQVVNLVVVTDGEPTDHLTIANRSAVEFKKAGHADFDGYGGEASRLAPYSVWCDPRTGKEYLLPHSEKTCQTIGTASGVGDSSKATGVIEMRILLDIFHDRIGGKAICINLVTEHRLPETMQRTLCPMLDAKGQPISHDECKGLQAVANARWRKDGWSSIKGGGGFDDCLFVQMTDPNAAQAPTTTAAEATDRILRSRKANRPLLVRVAELIAK